MPSTTIINEIFHINDCISTPFYMFFTSNLTIGCLSTRFMDFIARVGGGLVREGGGIFVGHYGTRKLNLYVQAALSFVKP